MGQCLSWACCHAYLSLMVGGQFVWQPSTKLFYYVHVHNIQLSLHREFMDLDYNVVYTLPLSPPSPQVKIESVSR